jgi:transcriptional regulator with XRE-family HTH domain
VHSLAHSPTRPPQVTLRQLRQARGWSQREVAKQVGVARSVYQKWEYGQALPKPINRWHLADLFGVGVGEIAFGQYEEQP